jgi:very-short-patch-repair endonuclease
MRLYGTKGMSRKQAAALKPKPDLEATFALQVRAHRLPPPKREFKFHPKRNWRFDFAWPEYMLAVEIEGGTGSNGRHVRPAGFREDCKKYNAAALLGWTVLRGDAVMVKTALLLDTVRDALIKRRMCDGKEEFREDPVQGASHSGGD